MAEEIKQTQRPITNPALVDAMAAMKQERTQKSEVAFVNALKTCRFLVPAKVDKVQQAKANEDGSVALVEQPQVRFLLFSSKEGKKYFPLFTDMEEYKKWNGSQEQRVAAVSFRDLCTVMQKDGATDAVGCVINPFSHNVTVPVETMIRVMNTEALAPGTKIQIGTLKEEPTELLDAVKAHLVTLENVEKAYLRVMKREDKERSNFLLVIDVDTAIGETALKSLFDGIANAAKPHLRGVELAIVPAASSFGKASLKDAVPFYEK